MKDILKILWKLHPKDWRMHVVSMKLIPQNIPVCIFLFIMEIFSRYYVYWNSQSNNYLTNVPCISQEYRNSQLHSLVLKLLQESGWKCFSAVLPLVINSSYGNKSWIYKGWNQLRLIYYKY